MIHWFKGYFKMIFMGRIIFFRTFIFVGGWIWEEIDWKGVLNVLIKFDEEPCLFGLFLMSN